MNRDHHAPGGEPPNRARQLSFERFIFGPPRTKTISTSSDARSPPAGTATAGTPATTVAEVEVAVATEAPTGARVEEVAPTEAAAGLTAPTAAPEAEQEEALKMVATLDAAEPLARRTAGKGVTPLLE